MSLIKTISMWGIGRPRIYHCLKQPLTRLAAIETHVPRIPQSRRSLLRKHWGRVVLVVIKYHGGSIVISNTAYKATVLIQISLFESSNQLTSLRLPRALTPFNLHMTSKILSSTTPLGGATSSWNSSVWEEGNRTTTTKMTTTTTLPLMMQTSLSGRRLPSTLAGLGKSGRLLLLLPSMKSAKKTTIGSSSMHSCYRLMSSIRCHQPRRHHRRLPQCRCRIALSPSGRWWACAYKVGLEYRFNNNRSCDRAGTGCWVRIGRWMLPEFTPDT